MESKDGMFDGGRERGERGLGENSWPSHSLWDRDILSKIGEGCGGFWTLMLNGEEEELQWARIRVRIKDEKIPNMVDVWVENMCYSLALWWETRPTLRALPTDERGNPSNSWRGRG
ncbi:hypothetical protein CK203_092840 [Vitis vinifera]|uniref:DUF4283 domain-containing protein n=1 Tax=Vitis vinifera TaxID=29760 RepID=A0A438DFH1_VITVI|nr:hypothetical protein CK203_092840 [Vitis vinifera]